ncbi:MAG: hypothetical protein ABIO95_00905 [Bdellovibrionota bacterium]
MLLFVFWWKGTLRFPKTAQVSKIFSVLISLIGAGFSVGVLQYFERNPIMWAFLRMPMHLLFCGGITLAFALAVLHYRAGAFLRQARTPDARVYFNALVALSIMSFVASLILLGAYLRPYSSL